MDIMYKGFLNLKFKNVLKFSRLSSFKSLQCELDFREQEMKNADILSKQANLVMQKISNFVRAGGGNKAIHRHTTINKKLLIYDRLKLLLDPGSPFLEIGQLAGLFMDYGNIPNGGLVAVIGKINNNFCMVTGNDATVKGGTFYPITVIKQIRSQQLAHLNKLPCIYIVDSGGAFLPLQADVFPDKYHGGRGFYNEAVFSSRRIPQIVVVCGSSTAGGAYYPTMAEEAIIVNKSGLIFLGGPPLVKAATGEIVTEQDLGGAHMHCSISGCTDYFAETEEEAFEMCRESVICFGAPHLAGTECKEPLYPSSDLLLLSGKEHLTKEDMYAILSRVLDGSEFKEFKRKYGTHLISGFGFIKGILVGMLANCGALTFQDAQKGAHFIQLCEQRNVPLCFLQNSGQGDEKCVDNNEATYETLKWRSKMVIAHSDCKVPKIALCVHGCFDDDNFTMCGSGFVPNFVLSWPLAHISSSRILKSQSRFELNKCHNAADMDEYEALFSNQTSAFYHASQMMLDRIVAPENTRQELALCLQIALSRKVTIDNCSNNCEYVF